ncbi:hypothetical protein BGZ58_003916 [Dissophora ornata]|nr:hypothetical protein BGZ58_003916 [Dissophora ornata]
MRSPVSNILLLWQALRQTYFTSPNAPTPPLKFPLSVSWLALTPPMGFNNWARYECNLNQQLFTDTADHMLSHGFLAAGYDTITVDDCWMTMERDPATKQLVVNQTLFPQGMRWIGEYLHQRGFKFGIYQDAGYKTCGGYPGSQGHFDVDLAQFSGWAVDYIKLDGCYINKNESLPHGDTLEPTFRQLYELFGHTIQSQSRPMVFSESAPAYFAGLSAGTGDRVGKDWYKVLTWVGQYGQLWRHSTDVAVYKKDGKSRWGSIMTNYQFNIRLARFQKPGNWNDPDFIITGDNEGLTLDEQKSQFGLWSIMGSPLILSTDVRQLSEEQIGFLTNKDIIAVNQDPLGVQARMVWRSAESDVLVKPMQNVSIRAVAMLNKQNNTATISVPFARLGYTAATTCDYLVRELFSQSEQFITITDPRHQSITTLLRPHTTALYTITTVTGQASCRASVPTGAIYLTSSLLCLDASNAGTAPGTPAQAVTCTSNESQVWQTTTAPPPFTDPNTALLTGPTTTLWIKTLDGLCLDTELDNNTPTLNSKVVVNPCDAARETQQWTYDNMQGTLFHASTGFCVDAPDVAALSSNTAIPLRLWECGFQDDNQVWSMPA